jgi:hypothetical protein
MFLDVLLLGVLAGLLSFLLVYWVVWELRGRGGNGQRLPGRTIAAIVLGSAMGLGALGAVVTHKVSVDGPLAYCVVTDRGWRSGGPAVGTTYVLDSGCYRCDEYVHFRLRLFWPSEIASHPSMPCP